MEISIGKKDILWGYLAQFFSIGAGLITLPLILNKLPAEEVGMNYILLSVGALVSLCDFGFAPLIGRNITYVFSGAHKLQKKGLDTSQVGSDVDYHLLAAVIETAKFIYRRVSLLVLLLLATLGTFYMYNVTEGFTNIKNSLIIWITYSVSVYFNLYFKYYNSLLIGAAKIVKSKKAIILSRSVYIVICYILVLSGCGLLSVVIANFISPFVERYYSYYSFYDNELKNRLKNIIISKSEVLEVFDVLWYTSKWLGLNMLGGYAYNQSGTFILGLYLPLADVASYGLMLQLFSIVSGLASSVAITYQPIFCKYRVKNDIYNLTKYFSMSILVLWTILSAGTLFIAFGCPYILEVIKSNSALPSVGLVLFFGLETILHENHAQFGSFIATNNEIPFVLPSLITGFIVVVLSVVFLKFFSLGILGIILSRFITETAYNHWKWPKWVLKELKIGPLSFVICGINQLYSSIIKLIKK